MERDLHTARKDAAEPATAARSRGAVQLRLSTLVGVVLGAFLLGLAPMWWMAYQRGSERDRAQEQLAALERENALATAAMLARQGEYERARESASRFFTDLNQHVTQTELSGAATPATDALRTSLRERDEIITLLARSDPASADRLTDLYLNYRAAQTTVPRP